MLEENANMTANDTTKKVSLSLRKDTEHVLVQVLCFVDDSFLIYFTSEKKTNINPWM